MMIIPGWLKAKGINLAIYMLNVKIVLTDGFVEHLLQDSTPYPYPYPLTEINEPSMTGLIFGAVVMVIVILIGVAIRQSKKN